MENFFSLDLCTPEKPEKPDRMGEEIVKYYNLIMCLFSVLYFFS